MVDSKVPRLPTAQPRVWSRKKRPCSQDNDAEFCRAQAPLEAEAVEEQTANSRQLTTIDHLQHIRVCRSMYGRSFISREATLSPGAGPVESGTGLNIKLSRFIVFTELRGHSVKLWFEFHGSSKTLRTSAGLAEKFELRCPAACSCLLLLKSAGKNTREAKDRE